MNVDKHTIEALLERYFEAETSIEEEGQLRRYFQMPAVDPALEPYRDLFAWQEHEKEQVLPAAFNQKILDQLKHQAPVRRLRVNRVLAYAASLALVFSLSYWGYTVVKEKQRETVMMLDTYEDPEEAYKQVTAALAMVAGAMDQGQQLTMESVAKTSELEILSIQ